jgi:hypothetical protein
MPSAREIRQQLLRAESARLKAREEAILSVIGAASRWRNAAEKAAEAERELHALTAAATEHMSPDEIAEFGDLPAKDVKSWAKNGAGLSTQASRVSTRGKPGVTAPRNAAAAVRSPSRTPGSAAQANRVTTPEEST